LGFAAGFCEVVVEDCFGALPEPDRFGACFVADPEPDDFVVAGVEAVVVGFGRGLEEVWVEVEAELVVVDLTVVGVAPPLAVVVGQDCDGLVVAALQLAVEP
jgi:hypothetical protein